MNWTLIIPAGLLLIALLLFLILRNQKDKKDLENQLNNDYRKPMNEEGDIRLEDTNKI